MPLTFDVSKVKDYSKNFPDVPSIYPNVGTGRDWNPVTSALVMAMMILGPLTDDVDEFWMRLNLYQTHVGALLNKGGEPRMITREEVENHVGIKVNVAPISKAKWDKWFVNVLRREVT